jgi:hypothetical protein
MNVKPVIGDWEIPRIQAIQSLEHRSFVELEIPGRVGSLFQDMNTKPTRIGIWGSLYGDETRNEFLEELRGKFGEGEPVTFVADIVTATEIQYVIIETLNMAENADQADQMDYFIVLQESPPPPAPSDPLGGIDSDLLDQADGFLDSATAALDVIDTLGSVPDLGNPVEPLSGLMDEFESTTEDLPNLLTSLTTILGEPEDE